MPARERSQAVEAAQRAAVEGKFPVRSLDPVMVLDFEDWWIVHFELDEPEGRRLTENTVIFEVDKTTGAVSLFPGL